MSKASQRGSNAERRCAATLVAAGVPAVRVLRGDNWGFSAPDVIIHGAPHVKIDSKHRAAWGHHSYLLDIERKYCSNAEDIAVLVTHQKNHPGQFATVRLEVLAELIKRSNLAIQSFYIPQPRGSWCLRQP